MKDELMNEIKKRFFSDFSMKEPLENEIFLEKLSEEENLEILLNTPFTVYEKGGPVRTLMETQIQWLIKYWSPYHKESNYMGNLELLVRNGLKISGSQLERMIREFSDGVALKRFLELFINSGFDVKNDPNSSNSLYFSEKRGLSNITKLLLVNGAKPKKGLTIYDRYSSFFRFPGWEEDLFNNIRNLPDVKFDKDDPKNYHVKFKGPYCIFDISFASNKRRAMAVNGEYLADFARNKSLEELMEVIANLYNDLRSNEELFHLINRNYSVDNSYKIYREMKGLGR